MEFMTAHKLAKKLSEGPDLPVFMIFNPESMASVSKCIPGKLYADDELREFVSLIPGFGVITGQSRDAMEWMNRQIREIMRRHEAGEYPFDNE